MQKKIKLNELNCEILLETPEITVNSVAVFLPSLSGGAFLDRFSPLVDSLNKSGIATARVSIWDSPEEAKQLSLDEIHKNIDSVVDFLRESGYTHIFGVGKSLGGAVVLTYSNKLPLEKKVLWAPAIGISEIESNIFENKTKRLGEFTSFPFTGNPARLPSSLVRAGLNVQKPSMVIRARL
ncbi:MAG: hypothetical protein WAW92_03075, partial [Minisyncoccia bacterium]